MVFGLYLDEYCKSRWCPGHDDEVGRWQMRNSEMKEETKKPSSRVAFLVRAASVVSILRYLGQN